MSCELIDIVLSGDIKNICISIKDYCNENKFNFLIKEFIDIYIKYYSCNTNLYIPLFISNRLDKLLTTEIHEKILCELYVFVSLLPTKQNTDDNRFYDNNIDSENCTNIFDVFEHAFIHKNCELCLKSCEDILKFKGNKFDERLLINSKSINKKYKNDSIWWIWFNLNRLIKKMFDECVINSSKFNQLSMLILNNYKIFRFGYNTNVRKVRVKLIENIIRMIINDIDFYEKKIYDTILIQVMLKYNFLKKINVKYNIYKNFLYIIPSVQNNHNNHLEYNITSLIDKDKSKNIELTINKNEKIHTINKI